MDNHISGRFEPHSEEDHLEDQREDQLNEIPKKFRNRIKPPDGCKYSQNHKKANDKREAFNSISGNMIHIVSRLMPLPQRLKAPFGILEFLRQIPSAV